MTAEGPRKGEPSTRIVRNGLRTQPANSVRGSSRRIMAMRFRPANISVINRRASSWAVIGPAVQKESSRPTSRNMFPLRRPSKVYRVPERCSQSRVRYAAPNTGAPLTAARRSGQVVIATGGSGGNMKRSSGHDKPKKPKPPPSKRVDRSLHISSRTPSPCGRSRARPRGPWSSGVSGPGPIALRIRLERASGRVGVHGHPACKAA
jgi:hypothetical protein